jgi:serine/threonine-protein kinase
MTAPQVPDRLSTALAGRYRVERELGAGGMATVYLAEDVKHSRKVAIKVLKPELAAVIGADRFLTEIKTTANLQHPHILPLFDSGEADSYLFYVMPFIEGESLRDRLDRERQLGVDEAVRIARDVADALDYAHRHGVIHRDIKPANILLHDGRPLVADFGIALAISAAGGGRLTETGLSLGTPHYMSPEQASAERDLSARSDVYSLGCVLYEMLSGEPPHTGPNAASILMRILTEQPRAISDLRPTVPLHVAGAVSKAVEKLPADRFETARQFRDALEDPSFRFTHTATAPAVVPAPVMTAPARRGWDTKSRVLAGTTVVFAATTLWLALRNDAPAPDDAGVISFQLIDSVPGGLSPVAGPGGWVAYVREGRIYVRPPGSLQATAIAGIDRIGDSPSFSPDGEWLAYTQGENATANALRKVPSRGGNPVPLGSVVGNALSPHWSHDGGIYFTAGVPGGWVTIRAPENGGTLDTVFRSPQQQIPYGYATHPGRRTLIFALFNASGGDPRLMALDLGSGDTSTIVPAGYHPRWTTSDHLLFARGEGSLYAGSLDRKGRVTGTPVPVLDSLAEAPPVGRFDISPSGTLVYVYGRATGSSGSTYSLRMDSLAGGHERIPLPPSDHWDAKFSPDGRRLAYIRSDHVWVYDLDLGTHTQLTKEGTRHHNPAWSADGQRVAFGAGNPERSDVDVYVTSADGKSAVERYGGTDGDDYPSQWVGDTAVLVYTQGLHGQNVLLIRKSAAEATPLLQADWIERNPRLSPDGRWLAYVSDENGRAHVYVRSFPALRSKVRISEGDLQVPANSFPLWSSDNRTLYFRQGTQIIIATVDGSGDSVRVSSRKPLSGVEGGNLQDIHPDGRRILVLASESRGDTVASTVPSRLVVVTNWLSTLRARFGK